MVEKRVKKFGQGSPPPPFRAMPERKLFLKEGFPYFESFPVVCDTLIKPTPGIAARNSTKIIDANLAPVVPSNRNERFICWFGEFIFFSVVGPNILGKSTFSPAVCGLW